MQDILIFDYDGVFVDSMDVVLSIHNNLCDKYNLCGIKGEGAFKDMFDDNFYKSMVNIGASEQKIRLVISEFENESLKQKSEIKLFPDIKQMLDKLSKKYGMIIVTSASSPVVSDFLEIHKIQHIDRVIGIEQERSKIKKILSVKADYPASEIYYIGDTKGDMIEGQKAGVKTIATTWGYHSRERLETADPDYIVDAPMELVSILV
ncbi:HAD family hydrolase [Candidatus Parcubacteria bacterium]|nr:HAD family hydrolase [Candidatus Parcubacteria bacterium]